MKTLVLKIVPLLLMAIWAGSIHAQPINTTAGTVTNCPGQTVVPVNVTNCNGIGAISLVLNFSNTNLAYQGYQNLNSALATGMLIINSTGNIVVISWVNTTPANLGNSTLVELKFNGTPGASTLSWDTQTPGNCEYANVNGTILPSTYTSGTATVNQPPVISVQPPVDKTIAAGQTTTFSVTATGSGLSYLWQVSTNGGGTFTNLSNGGIYSNVTTPTLTITGAQLSHSKNQYRCRVTGTCPPVVYSNPATLIVLPNVITTCGTVTGCPGQIIIPVNVTDFIGVAAFSLVLNYDVSKLTYTGSQNLNAAVSGGSFIANAAGGKVYLAWSNTSAATIPTGGLLVELKFTGVTGTSPLTWDTQTPGNCEYSDLDGLVIFSTWNNGNVTVNQIPAITLSPVNRTIYAGGSTTFSVTASGTGLTYLWQVSTNSGGTWTNLSNTAPYSGAFTSTLTINPVATGLNGYQYRCIVSGTCTPSVTSDAASLIVTQAAISTTPGTITNSCTGNLNVPVNVINCSNVGSISLVMIFDTTKMTFEGYHSVNAALNNGLLVVNRYLNKVIISWASITAANIGAGTLLQVRFKASANISTSLSWDTQTPGACEYADPNGSVITSFYNGSNISVVANALIVHAGSDIIMQASSVQLNGSATGGTPPYTWSWTPTTWLSNPLIPNPVASPVSTTTFNLTVTANNGCVGSDYMEVVVGMIPSNLTIQGVTIPNGVSNCYNAYQTITIAGNGTTFTVQNGGTATIIAGQKINLLPGTTVLSGGNMHAYITMNGQYCTTPSSELTVQNINVGSGSAPCFNASQKITVAGSGTEFVVQNGGSVTMIAGQTISYLYGTKVYSGGYLNGYITTNGQYCNTLPPPMVATVMEELSPVPSDKSMFRLYPNPTNGQFSLELTDESTLGSVYVAVYGTYGEMIFGDEMTGLSRKEFSLSGKPAGLYLVRVVNGNKGFTKKLIKQ